MTRINIALTIAMLTLSGCGSVVAAGAAGERNTGNRTAGGGVETGGQGVPQVEFGPEETMAGTYVTRFEHSAFEGCWFDMDAATYANFRRRFLGRDIHSARSGTFRLQIVGRRSVDSASGPPLYGHMGGWRCEIKASRIISAEEIGRDPSAPEQTSDQPAGKDGGAAAQTTGLSEGHDRARLEDIRRNLPPSAPQNPR
jgi:hypothetical protein